jgi:3-methyladenine DNA glycosylase AlkC
MSEDKAFKNLLGKDAATQLADQVGAAWQGFDKRRFVRLATHKLGNLELTDRVKQFSRALEQTLPADVPSALDILTRSLPAPLPSCDAVTNGFVLWPIGQFIADRGLDHFEPSMHAMVELTKRFSSEFAVRPFLERHPEATFDRLRTLCLDPNPHVRRWCSEGVRPRLPWGNRLGSLVDDPSPIFPILEALKDDPELYVRRSVANNLNDIAKDHPARVLATCKRWSDGASEQRKWLIQHALRTLIKQGRPEALALIGYGNPKQLQASLRIQPRSIGVGQSVRLELELVTTSTRPQELLVDYVVHFVRADGTAGSKVFKWTTTTLPGRNRLELAKNHAMKKTTIRTLYAGKHRVQVQVNGQRVAEAFFVLRT